MKSSVTPTKPARMKRRAPGQRRESIAKAALELFARQGFERTTTKEIARKAKVAEGSIYVHFKSKQDILFHFISERAIAPLVEIFSDKNVKNDSEIIREFIHDRFALWHEMRDLIKVVFGEALFNENLRKALKKNFLSEIIKQIETYISRRQKEGAFKAINPAIAARTLMGMIVSFFFAWGFMTEEFPDSLKPADVERVLTDLFLNGITSPKLTMKRKSSLFKEKL